MSRNYRHCSGVDDQPSFSSTLLDAIYRSIDENCESYEGEKQQRRRGLPHRKEEDVFLRESSTRKRNGTNYNHLNNYKSYNNHKINRDDSGMMAKKSSSEYLNRDCNRGYLVDQWTENTVMTEKHVVCHKSSTLAELDYKNRRNSLGSKLNLNSNSSSSSSDSSCGGGGIFSSSDTESSQYGRVSSNNSLKPIRTAQKPHHQLKSDSNYTNRKDKSYYHPASTVASSDREKPQHEHRQREHSKAKSRAMKIYGDLKRIKQPISPGGKLASFLNSLFHSGSAKKQRISSSSSERLDRCVRKSERGVCTPSTTTSLTTSTFSRSCLSKTPSSAGTGRFEQNGVKRSVRFCPVSVIVDEDCRPCGEKSLYGMEKDVVTVAGIGGVRRRAEESILGADEDFKFQVKKKNRQIEEVARDLLKNYHMKDGVSGFMISDEMKKIKQLEEDDDNVSCSSSDLFELENLLEIGVDRFCEELPVYETTHMDTNRAIANGLIV